MRVIKGYCMDQSCYGDVDQKASSRFIGEEGELYP